MADNFYATYPVVSGGGGGGGGSTIEVEYRTITSGEAGTKSLTLSMTPTSPTQVVFGVGGGGTQIYGTDFTVTGTTLSWSGTALDGILTTGDQVVIQYDIS